MQPSTIPPFLIYLEVTPPKMGSQGSHDLLNGLILGSRRVHAGFTRVHSAPCEGNNPMPFHRFPSLV